MNKQFFIFLFISSVFASYVGNPSAPRNFERNFIMTKGHLLSCRIGYEGDFIFDENFQEDSTFSVFANSGAFILNFLNRLDTWGVAGKSWIKAHWILDGDSIQILSKENLNWGYGIKIALFEWANTTLSIGGKYYKTSPKTLWISKNGMIVDQEQRNIHFSQRHLDAGLSQKIDNFVPYVVAVYSFAKTKLKVDPLILGRDFIKKSKKKYGIAFGCSLLCAKSFVINIEARLIDEKGFGLNGVLKF